MQGVRKGERVWESRNFEVGRKGRDFEHSQNKLVFVNYDQEIPGGKKISDT